MKNIVNISKLELKEMLRNWNLGAQPASIQYLTNPELSKEGKNKYKSLVKLANVGCMIGYDYERAVNLQLIREGKEPDFKRKPLWKGFGIHRSTALVEHKETEQGYLSYKKQQTFKAFYFTLGLDMLKLSEIKNYLKSGSKPYNQNTDKPVMPRTVKLDNIKKLKFRKTTYIIT